MSFRLKTILSIAFIESILLLVLVLSMINFLSNSNQEQLQQRAATTSMLLSESVKNAVLSTDLATLESIVENVLATPDIVYVRISNTRFMLAEGGDFSSVNLPSILDTELENVTDGVFDTRFEIIESGQVYGIVEMGLSTTTVESLLSNARAWIIAIASIEVFLVIILSFLLGTFLTRQLQQLKIASENITKQGPGLQIKVRGSDELAEVTHAFNQMSSTLESNYQQLSDSIAMKNEMTEIAERNQAKNNAILEASLDALITIDENGHVLDYNKVAESILGWSYNEVSGKNLADFIVSPKKRHAHAAGMKEYLDTNTSPIINQRLELTATHKSGRRIPIEINIAPIKTEQGTLFTAFIRDISERLEAETELRLAAQTFESNEAIFICATDATIIRTNHAFSRITGYDNEDVIGKNPRILSSGKHSKEYYENMWASLSQQGKWSGEIYNKRKNGEIYPEYLSLSSIKDGAGNISHYIAHFMDISEQKQNEENLRQAQREAEKSNESKSRFLAAMSHEIRTPMNAVLGILGLLKDTQLTQRQLELIQTGRDSGELLLSIINDILDYSKMDIDKLQLEYSNFDLHLLLANCNQLLSNLAYKKSLSLTLTLADDLPQFVRGDQDRIRQILINLINNAIKFTVTGGIDVRAFVDSINDDVVVLRCQVQDSGIGIEQAHQNNLFDEFTMVDQTYSRRHEGTGLGLAICKRLVALMNGKIEVNSTVGQGSTFEFTIELKSVKNEDAMNIKTLEQSNHLPQENTRVLLAEDNPANQMVIKSILEFASLQVDVVSNGYEALQALNERPYDIVLMDISMPEMDGMEATREIRKLDSAARNIPIVALTAHTLSGDKERFMAAGMDDYLSKPIDRSATLNCIANWTNKIAEDSKQLQIKPQEPAGDYVNEDSLQQLVIDTSAEVVQELIALYIEDSQSRMQLIQQAVTNQDIKSLEFQTHTIGSSAVAHGNAKLHKLSRKIECLCRENKKEQAIQQATLLIEVAAESFRLLSLRAQKGFVDP